MDYADVIAHYQAGQPVQAVIIGNSVSCGYNADGAPIIKSISQPNGKLKVSERESDEAPGAPTMLRAFLRAKNPYSRIINLCGDGWDTNDHLGISTPASSINGQTDSVDEVLAMKPYPDVVFLPLQINDALHGLSLDTFVKNTDLIINRLRGAGIAVVMVKENFARIPTYQQFVAEVDHIAERHGLAVIDSYTPFGDGKGVLADYAHPNSAGHELIFEQYKKWFSNDVVRAFSGVPVNVKTSIGKVANN
ncbi:SGNH/GDSL hydrolase family protein [Pseudomonas sp. LFM046]|uniref:SGNH/GDSL hydrolase family protein n=1 Tax=Pseudomonas sp. LFM046 TaxID=1608357 RepID=UPI0005CFD6EB|nr:SGNH/GDSL hydrolase family protein [Pseudomonas sp. LFM046]